MDDVGAGYFTGHRTGLPNAKRDASSAGAVSLSHLDGSAREYPDADHDRRVELTRHHRQYTQGLLDFLATDEDVPERLREGLGGWGLCQGEFQDTDGWPHQLNVREARRMRGEYVLTENNLFDNLQKCDPVGMGSYDIDVREVQRVTQPVSCFPEEKMETFDEGYLPVPVEGYQVPYRSPVPRWVECDNLLVPVCLSASHVAFASIPMEPQSLLLGHAAGRAATRVSETGRPGRRIDLERLISALRAERYIGVYDRDHERASDVAAGSEHDLTVYEGLPELLHDDRVDESTPRYRRRTSAISSKKWSRAVDTSSVRNRSRSSLTRLTRSSN